MLWPETFGVVHFEIFGQFNQHSWSILNAHINVKQSQRILMSKISNGFGFCRSLIATETSFLFEFILCVSISFNIYVKKNDFQIPR